MLSPKKQRFIDFIRDFTDDNTRPPTFVEIMDGLNVRSLGTINWYVGELEKEGIINGYVEKVLEPFMDSILETTNEIDIFNMLTSFFNISELYYNNGIPIKYIRILEELKIKTTSSKIRFKIMDILKE